MSADYCENCGGTARFRPLFSPARSTWRCQRCGGWTYGGPAPARPEELYGADYFFGGEYADYDVSAAAQRRNFDRKLTLLARSGCAIGPGSRVLEVGCATGEFLALLASIPGVRSLGVEVSAFCRERALARGLSVFAPDDPSFHEALTALRPNFVVGWDVWEHLPKPASTFDTYLAAAGRDVVWAVSTVDAGSVVARLRGSRWRQFHPPTHLQYPTRRSLRRFCADRSLELMLQKSFGYHRPLLEYVQALGLPVPEVTPAPMRAMPVYLNLWDTQLVVARRQS
jgi:SAM-dependent methyltransferase